MGACCCCSVAQSWPTLYDSMDCCTLGFPLLHSLLEFAQTHVHWISDAINHPILCHSLLLLTTIFLTSGSFPMTQLFASGGQSIEASIFPINIQGWFPLGLTGLIFFIVPIFTWNVPLVPLSFYRELDDHISSPALTSSWLCDFEQVILPLSVLICF